MSKPPIQIPDQLIHSVKLVEGGLHLSVHVNPGSKHEGIVGFKDGIPVVKIRERPIEGAANEALLKCLSNLLAIRKSAFKLIKGDTSRHKIVQIKGDQNELIGKIAKIAGEYK